jgi:hypothetical protein
MKVYLGKYRGWIGPYQIAEKLLFWLDPFEDDRVHNLGKWLAGEDHDSRLMRLCQWFDERKKRKIKVQIDPWDTWNMDHTLALIILPMLKQLRKESNGAPLVDDVDVPVGLRKSSAPPTENPWDADANHFRRWDWVMGEMIAAFEIYLEEGGLIVDDKARNRRDRGLRLFGKYYCGLWN